MRKGKKTVKQFEIEFHKLYQENYDFYQEQIDILFEGKKFQYQSSIEFELDIYEKAHFVESEIKRTKDILTFPNIAKLLNIFENHKDNISLDEFESISEDTFEIVNQSYFARINEFVNYELEYDSYMDEVTKLGLKRIAFTIMDLLSDKKYFYFLQSEYKILFSQISSPFIIENKTIDNTNDIIELETIDSSLIKWNKKKGEFYFLIDALEEGGFISYTGINKTEGMHQLARCLGIELSKNWQSTRTNLYKEEKIQFDNGKTNLFKELELAFNRMVEKKEIIINAKENNTKEQLAEIKSKRNQK
jgi:hypothetical protein